MLGLNLFVLRCADLEKSQDFYQLMGMQFTLHRHGSGPEHFACEDDEGVFELYPLSDGSAGDKTALGFAVDDLNSMREKLIAYSPSPIRDEQWGWTFVVRDPDGRRVELKQR